MSDLREARKELYFWRRSYSNSFTNRLFDLIGKADLENRERLRAGFPEILDAYEEWVWAKDESEYLDKILVEITDGR